MRPMLASKGHHVPTGAGWSHEVKWDGMRVLADLDRVRGDRRVRLFSRTERDVTVAFPELRDLPGGDLLLDGEVIALADGAPSFAALQDRIHVTRQDRALRLAEFNPVTYLIFDVLRRDGRDLTRLPLTQRRDVLAELDLAGVSWQVPAAYDDGAMLYEATGQQGLEGIVSKRLDSRYEPGARSPHWLKFPHRRRGSFVVGGWRHETDSTTRIGTLLVGEHTADGLHYRGRVGSGLAGKAGPRMLAAVTPLAASTNPFVDQVPRADTVGVQWIEPVLVVDVDYLGHSEAGRLRAPSYQGLRTDLTPQDLLTDLDAE